MRCLTFDGQNGGFMLRQIKFHTVSVRIGLTDSQEKRLEKVVKKKNEQAGENYLTVEDEIGYFLQVDSNTHIEQLLQMTEKHLGL